MSFTVDDSKRSSSGTVTVAVADRRPETAALIARMLDREAGFAVTGTASDRRGVTRMLARSHPDVLVLDHALVDGPGLGQLVLIQQASPHTRMVVVGMGEEAAWSREAERHRVAYLTKHASLPAWMAAIEAAAARGDQAL